MRSSFIVISVDMDQLLDKRLVRTLLQTIQVIIASRERVGGLLLS
jgi:hypothetical protein